MTCAPGILYPSVNFPIIHSKFKSNGNTHLDTVHYCANIDMQ